MSGVEHTLKVLQRADGVPRPNMKQQGQGVSSYHH
jgi:hypothetical protein